MNAAKKTTENKSIDEKLNDLTHLVKALLKGQQAIISHLYQQNEPEELEESDEMEHQKQEAIKYINSVVMPEIEAAQAEQGELSAQGIADWLIAQIAAPIYEYLKAQALTYIGQALTELKKQAIPLAVKAADWVLDKLENILVNQYSNATDDQKEQFKEEIEKSYPNSRLLEKLN